jgi:hypothetical protein
MRFLEKSLKDFPLDGSSYQPLSRSNRGSCLLVVILIPGREGLLMDLEEFP